MARILVIDDSLSVRVTLEYCLRAAGHDVVLAENGMAGVNLASAQPMDLILADINMPGMDGIAVCRAIRGQPKLQDIPVLLMTGCLTKEALQQAQATGVRDVLSKPFVIADLVGTLARHLAARGGDPQSCG